MRYLFESFFFLYFSLALCARNINNDSIYTYKIVNESLCSIVDSLDEAIHGESVYVLTFSNYCGTLYLVVLHLKNENEIMELVDDYNDYYCFKGCLTGYRGIYIVTHQVDECQMQEIVLLTDIRKRFVTQNTEEDNTPFVYQENIAYVYKNHEFHRIKQSCGQVFD